MNTTSEGTVPIPLSWLRAGWVVLMVYMIITLLFGVQIAIGDLEQRLRTVNMMALGGQYDLAYILLPALTNIELHSQLTMLQHAVNGIVLLMVVFVMVASTIIYWKAERQQAGILLAFTLLIYWTTDSTFFDALTKAELTPLYVYFRAPILILRAAALPLALSLLFTFPDGRFSPRWTRWLLLGYSGLTVLYLLIPDLPTNTIYGATWRRTPLLSFAVAIIPFLIGIYAQIRRYRRAATDIRNQIKWTMLGTITMVVGVMIFYGIYAFLPPYQPFEGMSILVLEAVRQFVQLVLAVILPILCLMIAIFRYRLWSADPIINRLLVYTSFIGMISLLYFVGILVVSMFVSFIDFAVSIPVTIFILLIFQPLRERVQRTVDHLMFGDRGNPLAVLSQMDTQITLTETTDRALFAIAGMLAQTLKVPCVLVTMLYDEQERSVTASYGQASGRLRVSRFPMTYGERNVGEIALYQDAGDRAFTPTERQLIEMVTRQTGLIVNTIQLNSALQLSRQNIISAREEERRRLRRDLHDGLGPRLAAHMLKVGKARALIPQQPTTASDILSSVETDLTDSLGEIRHLVESLRPPILDQLGLVGSIREFMSPLLHHPHGDAETRFSLTVESEVPELPAAVEVAAYRIITEAVTNVLRHANASACQVVISANGELLLRISDDGIGLPVSIRQGVGLNSMRERAAEVGGYTNFSALFPTGTQVEVRLPLS